MRKFICWLVMWMPVAGIAQNYNPFVSQGIVFPAPLLPVEANGSGNVSFNIGNSGSDALPLVTNQEMLVVVTLSRGVPDNADPIAAITGTFKSYFNWTYNATIRTYQGVQNKAIPGGLNGAGTIVISYKVAQNSPMLAPQNGFNCNITPPAYSNGINSLNDDQVSSYTWTSFYVTGKIFDDADGYTDGMIDGTGTNANGKLYISLVGSGNNIIATVPVNADGSYEMFPPGTGSYTLTLHTSASGATVSSVPSDYVNTAEGFGTTSDGTANGYLAVNLSNANILNANFGIDQLPETQDVNAVVAAGIVQGEKIVLNNQPLSASDPEDGNVAGSLSTGYTFIITSLPNNASLYYNDVLISPADVAAGNGTALITNYDPAKLSIVFNVPPVAGTQAIFTYAAVDLAMQRDATPATYTLSISEILPAENLVLSAHRNGNDILLRWEMLSEQETDYFTIEKSTDGRMYKSIGNKVHAAGNSNQRTGYQLLDKNEVSPAVLYRAKLYYKNGKISVSNVAVVRMNGAQDKILVFPNPVSDQFSVSFTTPGKYRLQLVDAGGKIAMTKDVEITVNHLNFSLQKGNLAAGNYHLNIFNNNAVLVENVKLIFVQR